MGSYSVEAGLEESVLLLLSSVSDGRLTLDDVTERLSTNAVEILGLSPTEETHIEVEVDRPARIADSGKYWSPLASRQKLSGAIDRVVLHGQTTIMESEGPARVAAVGKDLSASAGMLRHKSTRFSVSGARPQLTSTFSQSSATPAAQQPSLSTDRPSPRARAWPTPSGLSAATAMPLSCGTRRSALPRPLPSSLQFRF